MPNKIEHVFENKTAMLKRLKKEQYEKYFKEFSEKNSEYFEYMLRELDEKPDKDKALNEASELFVTEVENTFKNKKGKINGTEQVDLNFFMIYYVFPLILKLEHSETEALSEKISISWGKRFKDSNISYTSYEKLYETFRVKIFGIF